MSSMAQPSSASSSATVPVSHGSRPPPTYHNLIGCVGCTIPVSVHALGTGSAADVGRSVGGTRRRPPGGSSDDRHHLEHGPAEGSVARYPDRPGGLAFGHPPSEQAPGAVLVEDGRRGGGSGGV